VRQVTVFGVRIPGGNHVDRRRSLLPRDYLVEPDAFGQGRPVTVRVPPGGDEVSARIALLQHELVRRWRQSPEVASGAAIGRRYGFSRQTWSRTALGQRWMGEAVLAGLIEALGMSRP
jgi:hypothetical protein